MSQYSQLIRNIADFPKPGVVFKDITPLLADAAGLAWTIRAMAEPWQHARLDAVAGIESRGFILAAALARELDLGFVPLRKPGKLPAQTVGVDYELEYGHDRIEAHADAIAPGARVLLVDDVLATGGTLAAAASVIERLGGELAGAGLLLEIAALNGRQRWRQDRPLQVLLSY